MAPETSTGRTNHRKGWGLWRRLDIRLFALFLVLLLLVQLLGLVAIRQAFEANAQRQMTEELRTGEVIFKRLLAQNVEKLTDGARLLSFDFGFRSAVASHDRATILDALDNQGSRMGATVALLTDRQNELLSATTSDASHLLPLVLANLQASGNLSESSVHVLDARPFQLITVPLRAPHLIGHVSMGFALTGSFLQDVAALSSIKAALLVRPRGARQWAALGLGDTGIALREAGPVDLRDAQQHIELGGEHFTSRLVMLSQGASHDAAALLLRSTDEVVEPYRKLQASLLIITLAGLLLTGVGSLLMAKRVTRPLKQLSSSAERLGGGDFTTPVAVTGSDEVGELARSFEAMRQAVQTREGQIKRLAYWDPLTDLPNREQFRITLRHQLERVKSQSEPCAVLMLDLDRFKNINDVLGPAFGDRVLRAIADRLSGGLLRDVDMVARLQGDEFGFSMPGVSPAMAVAVAERIRAALDSPLVLDEQTVDVAGCVGVATYPQHGLDADLLTSRAEIAMYAAKDRRAGVLTYDPSMDSASAQSLSLLSDLRMALQSQQLQVFLQPKIALASGRVVGAESLLRWQHPLRGMVSPAQFIPFAEQTGFIREMTAWMIEHTAQHVSAMPGPARELKFAVNLSTRDLIDQDLPAKVDRWVQAAGWDPQHLTLEITESSIMEDPERALQTLLSLRALGARLSIDDFGTGYSSLAYLRRLPLDELKIDRSFVVAMQKDPTDVKIVRSTIDLAHNLGLSVVAEGIEDAPAVERLRALGCDEAQGFFFARPMPAAAFADWVRQWRMPEASSTGFSASTMGQPAWGLASTGVGE